jgi:hypothetical protein
LCSGLLSFLHGSGCTVDATVTIYFIHTYILAHFLLSFPRLQWSCPTELYGIGKYAADAYYIFCR